MEKSNNDISFCIWNQDNKKVMKELLIEHDSTIDLIYADMMYDDFDFSWVDLCREFLKDSGSIFIQTDYRSVAELKIYLDNLFGKDNFVNWIIWSYDWGGRSRRRFARKHDDILWYSKTKEYKFYPERVAIPKVMTDSKMNPSGRNTKIPTDTWSDLGNFHTMSSERIKGKDGKNIRWQKPLKLLDRVVLSTTDNYDIVFDPFLGSGSTAISAFRNLCHFLGIEYDKDIYDIALERITDYLNYYEKTNNNSPPTIHTSGELSIGWCKLE